MGTPRCDARSSASRLAPAAAASHVCQTVAAENVNTATQLSSEETQRIFVCASCLAFSAGQRIDVQLDILDVHIWLLKVYNLPAWTARPAA